MMEVEELYKSLSYVSVLLYHHLNPERCFILQRRTIFMFDISAKKLIYLSIILGFFVLLATLGILLFPETITKRDRRLARKKTILHGNFNFLSSLIMQLLPYQSEYSIF